MFRRRTLQAGLAAISALLLSRQKVVAAPDAAVPDFSFPSIDGGTLNMADWRGKPVLVVNTASLCGFTPQLEGMQALHEQYGPKGLVVLATPSDDFAQELDDAKKVKEFCTITYGITLPMSDIIHVARGDLHPFYAWLKDKHGYAPAWNFGKVLLGPEGQVVQTWGSMTKPESDAIREAFSPYLTA